MGVVYKAEDTQLRRTVAVKFLPRETLDEEEVKARLIREAQAAAALDHPNICQVFGIHEEDGETFIAMAYIDGPSLADKIKERPLPLDEALTIATQIAEGLHEAHEHGVVHRDIKPQNILLTAKGQVKILDFGLASLTGRSKLTKTGTTLGTPAYMAPEQLEGKNVDRRADVWALGCVLYEMLTQKSPFEADYEQAIGYGILNEDPEPISAQRADVKPEIDRLIAKALTKDPAERYQHADDMLADLRVLQKQSASRKASSGQRSALTSGAARPTETLPSGAVVVQQSGQRAVQVLAAVLGIAFLGLLAIYFTEPSPLSPPTVDFSIPGPVGLRSGVISLSPDGRHLVMSEGQVGSLWLRSLDSMEWRELVGTEDASDPFWSPDSDQIGFFAAGRLKKVALAGGPSQTIGDVSGGGVSGGAAFRGGGGSWGTEGTILFAEGYKIYSISASGGEPVLVTEASEPSRTGLRFPHFLPDGRHFLYRGGYTAPELAGIYLGSLNGETPRRLLPDASNAFYVPREPQAETGFLVFAREGTLMAHPFDPDRLELSAGPIALPAVQLRTGPNFYPFSASPSGALALSGSSTERYLRLVWVDRAGTVVERTDLVEAPLAHARLSPDGGRVAYSDTEGTDRDIWTYDLDLGTRAPLSNKPLNDHVPVWSPDGAQVAFQSDRPATRADILVGPADASEPPADLLSTDVAELQQDWSHDGRFILYTSLHAETRRDIWYLERTEAGDDWEPHVFLNTPAEETHPRLSPDGRYVAYVSTESGRREIYVRPFPDGGRRTTVSTAGGNQPVWRRDGSELFYIDPDNTLMAADVSTAGEFTSSGVTRLFQHASLTANKRQTHDYDVSLDGQRFLLLEPVNADGEPVYTTGSTIRVITNWPAKYAPDE